MSDEQPPLVEKLAFAIFVVTTTAVVFGLAVLTIGLGVWLGNHL